MEQNQGAQAAQQAAPAAPVAPVAQPASVAPAAPAPQAPVVEAQPAASAAPVTTQPAESPRTQEQMEKLLDSNQRLFQANELLRQELQRRAQSNQTFAPVQPNAPQVPTAPVTQQAQAQPQQPLAQQPVMPKVTDFIETDPATGEKYINQTKFESSMTDYTQRLSRTEQMLQSYITQSQEREVDRQNREAFASYPELNPASNTFDARFMQQARAVIYDSMINPQDYGGRPLGYKDAADFLKGGPKALQTVPQPQVPTLDPTVAAQNQTAKEQASLAATPQPQQATSYANEETAYNNLVMGTRMGSDEALARRLVNAPHKIDDVEALQTR